MTCIVGYKKDSRVWLGGDGLGIDTAYDTIAPHCAKVWRQGSWVWGSSGSYRAIQLVRNYIKVKKPKQLTEAFLVQELIPAIKSVFENHAFEHKTNGQSSQEADFLVGNAGKLFALQSDYSILEVADSYYAIGSGGPAARGALYALTRNKKLKPEEICKQALQAAAHHNAGVGPPYKIVSTS